MGFRDNLRDASFKGIKFFVDTSELSAGRKTVVHSFPDKDNPNFIEDQGKATRIYNIEAFVIGDDYLITKDRLIRACEDKEIGVLIHPFYGKKKVKLIGTARIRENITDGGMAIITMSLSETEEIQFPIQQLSTISELINAVTSAIDSVNNTLLDVYDVLNTPATILNESLSIIDSTIETLNTVKKISNINESYQRSIDKLQSRVDLLQLTAGGLVDDFTGIFGISSSEVSTTPSTISGGQEDANQNVLLNNIQENLGIIDSRKTLKIDSNDENTIALQNYIIEIALVAGINSVINMEFISSDQANETQNKLIEEIDFLLDNSTNDVTLQNFADLKTALINDIINRGSNLPTLEILRLEAVANSLSLSYKLYKDLDRVDEILARNAILHPGFIPAGVDLEVLSE